MDPHSARLHPDVYRPAGQLDVRQRARAELNGRALYQPRGKVLGGTSSINGMVYMRGTSTDYDGWRQKGCEGWAYDDVLPFFKKAEDQERGADEFHGVGGPLHVSNPVRCALGDAMVQAAIEAGSRPTTISTAPARKGSAITRRRPPTAGAGVRRGPISAPPRAAPT